VIFFYCIGGGINVTENEFPREAGRTDFLNEFLDRFAAAMSDQTSLVSAKSTEIIAGIDNLAKCITEKGQEIIVGMDNVSQLLNQKLGSVDEHVWLAARKSADVAQEIDNLAHISSNKSTELIAGLNNLSQLLNEKLGSLVQQQVEQTAILSELPSHLSLLYQLLNQKLGSVDEHVWLAASKSADVALGIDNLTHMSNNKSAELIVGLNNLSQLLNEKLGSLVQQQVEPTNVLSALQGHINLLRNITNNSNASDAISLPPAGNNQSSLKQKAVRILEGYFSSMHRPSDNAALLELAHVRTGNRIKSEAWVPILQDALAEIESIPKTRKILELLATHAPHHNDNALLLFWLIRRLKPRKIVQVAEVGDLSSPLMVLALAKNDRSAQLHLLEALSAEKDQRSSWLLPDKYGSRFKCHGGDSKIVLPKIIDELDTVDLFVTGFGRTHAQVLLDLMAVRGKISKGGAAVVCGGSYTGMIQWFSDQHGVPALDFNGSLAVAFL
jgi:hypothetical protein